MILLVHAQLALDTLLRVHDVRPDGVVQREFRSAARRTEYCDDLQEPYFLDLSQCYSGYPSKVMPPNRAPLNLFASQAPSHLVMGYWCLQVALYTSELVTCLTGAIPRKKESSFADVVCNFSANLLSIGLFSSDAASLCDSSLASHLLYCEHGSHWTGGCCSS